MRVRVVSETRHGTSRQVSAARGSGRPSPLFCPATTSCSACGRGHALCEAPRTRSRCNRPAGPQDAVACKQRERDRSMPFDVAPSLPLRPRIKVAARAPRTETPNVSVQPRVVPLGSRRRQTRSTPSRSAARRTTSSLHISSLMPGYRCSPVEATPNQASPSRSPASQSSSHGPSPATSSAAMAASAGSIGVWR